MDKETKRTIVVAPFLGAALLGVITCVILIGGILFTYITPQSFILLLVFLLLSGLGVFLVSILPEKNLLRVLVNAWIEYGDAPTWTEIKRVRAELKRRKENGERKY